MPDIRLLRVDGDERAAFSVADRSILQISGLAHLVQTVVNHLLTTPGSDRLSPHRGAGLSDLCRRHRTNSAELKDQIADRIDRVDQQIRDEQSDLSLKESERLESLSLISATPDPDRPTRLNIVVGIESAAGEQAQISV